MANSRGSGRKRKLKPPGKVVVRSKTYGRHERAARGTVTPAELNESMKAYGERMIRSNMPARLIQDAQKPFRANFTGGQLWQSLVKHFAAQANEGLEYSVVGLQSMDLHKYYTTSRIMSPAFNAQYNEVTGSLDMTFNHTPESSFLKRAHYVNGFRITIIAMFPDFRKNTIVTLSEVLPHRALRETVPVSFFIKVPGEAMQCLLGYKIEGTKDGNVCASMVTRCMYFSHAIEFHSNPRPLAPQIPSTS